MPFSGGASFVALQACGWGTYGSMLLLVALHLIEGGDWQASPLVAAVPLVWGLNGFLRSIPLFQPNLHSPSASHISWFEKNAEASVAALLFYPRSVSCKCTTLAVRWKPVESASILVSVTSMLMALPLSAVALRKTHTVSYSHEQVKQQQCVLLSLDDVEATQLTDRCGW